MRSPRGFAAALILLLGALGAIIAGAVFGDGAENVIHMALGVCFILLAFAVFDFKLPAWINIAACVANGALGAVFLLQGVADMIQSSPLRYIAYEVLGQRLEKVLGYAFLLWCAAMFFGASTRKTKVLGAIVLALILGVEVYTAAVAYVGGSASEVLKLLYLPLFIWLLLESVKPSQERRSGMA